MKKLSFVALILCATSFAQTNVARMLSGVNAQTGTSYTFVASDVTKIVTFNNANPVGATLPLGTTTGFGAGSVFTAVNLGAGTVTIACSGCTINGAASIQVVQNSSVSLYGDGTNYISASGGGGGGGSSIAGSTALGTQVGGNGAGGFASTTKSAIDPRDYGVDCSDTNDSTTAWAAAVTAAGNYGKIVVPAHCLFKLTGTPGFSLYKVYGLEIEFAGRQGNGCDNQSPNPSGIDYRQAYAGGNSVISIIDSQRLVFRNLTIYTNGGADNGILIDQDGSTPPITTRNDFYNTCIYNNTASRNSSWKGISVSPVSLSNVENIHFYHPDVTCSSSSATSASSNGYAIWFSGSANLKNEIIDDYNAHNCSVDIFTQYGGDITTQFGLASNSFVNVALGGFNDSLYGFRSENATNAVSINNSIGPHLIYHNDFAASAGTIVDCPSGCGSLSLFNNQTDSAPGNWFNVHGASGTSGPLIAFGNRNFSWASTDWQLGAFVQSGFSVTSTFPRFLLTPSEISGAGVGGNVQSPAIDLQSLSGVSAATDDYVIQNLPSGPLSNTPASSTLVFGHAKASSISPWLSFAGTLSGLTFGQITNTANLLVAGRGSAGSTSYSYQVVAHGNVGSTPASNTATIATGNATLNGTNFNQVQIPMVAGCTYFDVYRTASAGTPSSIGKIGTADCFSTAHPASFNASEIPFNDTGLAGDSATPPTINTTGKIITAASTTGAAGLNLPHGAAPTTPIDGDFWTTTAGAFVRINGGTIGPLSAGGGGGLSGMTALGIPIATSSTNIASSTAAGTNQGTYIIARSNTVQGSATTPFELQVADCSGQGTITGATATYTIIYSDVTGCNIVHDIAGSVPATITIPTPATLHNPAPIFVYSNYSASSDTLSPVSNTIGQGASAAAATLTVGSGVACKVQLDPVNAATWKADCHPMSTSVGSVSVNGSGVSSPNFNGSTPAAQANFQNATIQNSGSNVSVEVPLPTIPQLWLPMASLGEPIATLSNQTDGGANNLACKSFSVPAQITPAHVTADVAATSAGQTFNIAIYDNAGNLLKDSGSMSCSAGNAVTAALAGLTLTPGNTYGACVAISDTTCALIGASSVTAVSNIANKNVTRDFNCANALAAGAMPATCGVATPAATKNFLLLLEQ